jgi:hypothetical protein
MRFPRHKSWICLLGLTLLAGCGVPGVPLPPELELPRPVTDLHAFRKGESVYLTWSTPTQTTEHRNLRRGGTADICRAIAIEIKNCSAPVARVPFQPVSSNASPSQRSANYTDQLPHDATALSTSSFVYAVSVLNPYDRSAGLSNQVEVPAAPTLAPPSNFRFELSAQGVELEWNPVTAPAISGLRFIYRVYRREQGSGKDAVVGELPVTDQSSPSLLDSSFEWEKTYDYRATIVTVIAAPNGAEQQIEGDDTPSVRVVAHDVFPPATPSGLQAVFSGPGQKLFVDLVWTPDTEADLAGYNVYRREDDGQWTKLNIELIKTPAFRDAEIVVGHEYHYSVSAVDVRGNESARSEEAGAVVPAQ